MLVDRFVTDLGFTSVDAGTPLLLLTADAGLVLLLTIDAIFRGVSTHELLGLNVTPPGIALDDLAGTDLGTSPPASEPVSDF